MNLTLKFTKNWKIYIIQIETGYTLLSLQQDEVHKAERKIQETQDRLDKMKEEIDVLQSQCTSLKEVAKKKSKAYNGQEVGRISPQILVYYIHLLKCKAEICSAGKQKMRPCNYILRRISSAGKPRMRQCNLLTQDLIIHPFHLNRAKIYTFECQQIFVEKCDCPVYINAPNSWVISPFAPPFLNHSSAIIVQQLKSKL